MQQIKQIQRESELEKIFVVSRYSIPEYISLVQLNRPGLPTEYVN